MLIRSKIMANVSDEIKDYIKETDKSKGLNSNWNDWYVGVSKNPANRIQQHKNQCCNPNYQNSWGSDDPQLTENRVKSFGVTAHPGGGDDETDEVYVFYDPNMGHTKNSNGNNKVN